MTKAKGNMYVDVTHTHNDIKGKCLHCCSYCYMTSINKRFNKKVKEPYLDEKELTKNLGSGNIIFIGSSTDMWARNIPKEWILKVLFHTDIFPDNMYLFQTKNPWRYMDFIHPLIGGKVETELPKKCILGTTIETNRNYLNYMGETPPPNDRAKAIEIITSQFNDCFITIEPILDFDIELFVPMLKDAMPKYINIGADSGNNHLPEPEPEKIRELIKELEKFTKVHLKKNLKRLLPEIN